MLSIYNLNKSLDGVKIIDNLTLNLVSGEITALVGKNGCGKTTLIRLISGLLFPDSGQIVKKSRCQIGTLLGGDVNFHNNLTALEILTFFGKIYGISNADIKERISMIDDIISLKPFLNKQAYTFSRGMKQKLAFAISVIHDPEIILLDEPSTGFDIEVLHSVIKFIKFLSTKNKTILISTHNTFEIFDLSDNIAFISNGKINKIVKTKDFCGNLSIEHKLLKLMNEVGV